MGCSDYKFFLVAYMFGIVVYLTVTVNSLRTIVHPVENVDTRGDQIEAMRVLSAGNVIIAVCLGLILVLQVNACSLIWSLLLTVYDLFVFRPGRSGRNVWRQMLRSRKKGRLQRWARRKTSEICRERCCRTGSLKGK